MFKALHVHVPLVQSVSFKRSLSLVDTFRVLFINRLNSRLGLFLGAACLAALVKKSSGLLRVCVLRNVKAGSAQRHCRDFEQSTQLSLGFFGVSHVVVVKRNQAAVFA